MRLLLRPPAPLGPLLALHNFTEETRYASLDLLHGLGMTSPVDRISGRAPRVPRGDVELAPYEVLWLASAS
ncbi:hypothetical protein [Rubrobacter marinus]|uniref:hypothetical protein n=1 Tax=Rubrobacter marinus TaxID=2653852 RepID=UPI00389AA102